MNGGDILVLNAGSSSIKFALFDRDLGEVLSGLAEIGHAGTLSIAGAVSYLPLPDHHAGLQAILAALAEHGVQPQNLRAAAHRVVHGGDVLTAPARLTKAVRDEIAACIPLAPLHNPHNLAAIDALAALAPDLAQYASFDTSFHSSNPKVATRYALPDIPETKGIHRYGFHGLSYASLSRALPGLTGAPLPARLLAFHLGNGASLCAIENGRSVATTMGFSPLDGLTMGTRSGGISAGAVMKLIEENGLPRTREILHYESGLSGLSGGKSDMRRLLEDPSPEARFAIDHFTYWCRRHAGSLIAAMQGLDAIAFTGGIGENAVGVRMRILRGLEWAGVRMDPDANHRSKLRLHSESSKVHVWVVPAEEEKMIAMDALEMLKH